MDHVGHDIVYRWTEESDVRGVVTLFNLVTPVYARSVRYWRWSNTDGPFGKSLSVVAKSGERVVAHYSILPLNFFVNGRSVVMGFGLQAVVQKEFRNLKIMKTLTDLIFDRARKEFVCTYAFPSEHFFLVKKQLLGWKDVDVFMADVIAVKDLDDLPHTTMEVKEIQVFPPMDWFKNNGVGIFPWKTSDYLNWRFIQHPINHYVVLGTFHHGECVGYLVLKVYFRKEDTSMIGHFVDYDTKGKDESILLSLIVTARELFKFYGVEEIVFWNKEVAFKGFFQRFITGQGFKTNMGILIGDKNLEDVILKKENWSFTMAVSDAF